MASTKTSLFSVPATQLVETIYVRLTDGTVVARTPAQLAVLPAGSLGLDSTTPATS